MHHQHFYSILRQHGPRGRSGIARKTRRGPREARHIGRTHGRPIGAEAIYCAGITRRRIRAAAVPCFFLPSPRRVRDRSGRLPIPAAHPRARSHGHPVGPGPAFVHRDAPRSRPQSTPRRAARCAVLRPARASPPPARQSRAEQHKASSEQVEQRAAIVQPGVRRTRSRPGGRMIRATRQLMHCERLTGIAAC